VIRSDGTLLRDYLHVDDAVSAYLVLGAALLEGREHAEAFNFGHGTPVSVLEIVNEIRSAVESDIAPLIQANAPNEIQAQWLDSTKAADRLGWRPSLSLHDGIAATVPWYRDLLA
jgi:nucleoside-diphosphate-sugar epimerase